MADLTYLEHVESVSPSSAGASMEDARSVRNYFLEGSPTATNLNEVITDLVGQVNPAVGDGRVNRQLPKTDPVFQSWLCSGIQEMRGWGKPTKTAVPLNISTSPASGFYGAYPTYQIKTEFRPRPYAVLPNSSIVVSTASYWNRDGDRKYFLSANEWLRFTDYTQTPMNNFVTAKTGQMRFHTASGTAPGANAPNKIGSVFTESPRMLLPDSVIKMIWYLVPFRYVSSINSYLQRFVGYINQTDWYNWKKGQLLFMGATPHKFTPPFQRFFNIFGVNIGQEKDKLCNIELTFIYTSRTGTDVPTSGSFFPNANWIAAGHNLLPWLATRKFYYVTSYDTTNPADQTKWFPSWPSVPFEFLFTDPDTAQPDPVIS